MPVASKAVPSVIASSVCWSLQCLVSALTQRGWWRTLFFCFFFFRLTCSVALWGGREGCCKQTTLACARSASATLGLPTLFTAHAASLPTLLRLYVAPQGTIRGQPWAACSSQVQAAQVQALGYSSEAQTLSWACVLCSSQIRAAQVMRCLAHTIAATYRLPAALFSRCATGAPS